MGKEKAPGLAGTLSNKRTLSLASNNRRLNKTEIIEVLILVFFPELENEPSEISSRRSEYRNSISAATSLNHSGFLPIIDAADFLIFQFRSGLL